MIDNYSFGKMAISGQFYRSDLKIYSNRKIDDSWRRKESHVLTWEDIEDLITDDLELLVIGMGIPGKMKPEKALLSALKEKSINYYAAASPQAVQYFNQKYVTRETAACFHLTC